MQVKLVTSLYSRSELSKLFNSLFGVSVFIAHINLIKYQQTTILIKVPNLQNVKDFETMATVSNVC